MANKLSYSCPQCGETLTFDECYVNLVGWIDITCPACKRIVKGCELKKPEPATEKKQHAFLQKEVKPSAVQEPNLQKTPNPLPKTYLEVAGFTIVQNYIDETGTPGGKGDFYKIAADKTIVGRQSNSSKADIQIASNRYMSRQHVVITKEKEGYRIKWIGKTNPLLVNDIPVTDENGVVLKDGDKITMGQCVAVWKYVLIDSDQSILL